MGILVWYPRSRKVGKLFNARDQLSELCPVPVVQGPLFMLTNAERFAYGGGSRMIFHETEIYRGREREMETPRIPSLSPGSDIKIFASRAQYTHRVWDFPIVLLSLCLTRRPANKLYFRDPRGWKISNERETIQPLSATPPRIVATLFPCWLLEDQQTLAVFLHFY